MNTHPGRAAIVALAAAIFAACSTAAPPASAPAAPAPAATSAAPASSTNLEGSSWRLVQIAMSDGVTRPAIDRSRYTIGFGTAGVLNVRFDCNRGRGSWTSASPGQVEFGPLSLTRAMCPMGSLHDELVRQWPHVRGYVVKDGRLFLTLMADGGTIEFEPAP
jgi:para-nitrobenzyl esterase